MTDDMDYTVSSRQLNGTGALAMVEGLCRKEEVVFAATLYNADDTKVPLGFAVFECGWDYRQKAYQ